MLWRSFVGRVRGLTARERLIGLLLFVEADFRHDTVPIHAQVIARRAECEPDDVWAAIRVLEKIGALNNTGTRDTRGRQVWRLTLPAEMSETVAA